MTYEDIVLAGMTVCLIAALVMIDQLKRELDDAGKRMQRLVKLLDDADRNHRYARD